MRGKTFTKTMILASCLGSLPLWAEISGDTSPKKNLSGLRSLDVQKESFFIPTEGVKVLRYDEVLTSGPWVAKHMLLRIYQSLYEIDFAKQKISRLSTSTNSFNVATALWLPWTSKPLQWIQIHLDLPTQGPAQIWIQSIPSSFRPPIPWEHLSYYQLNARTLLMESRASQMRWQVVYESIKP